MEVSSRQEHSSSKRNAFRILAFRWSGYQITISPFGGVHLEDRQASLSVLVQAAFRRLISQNLSRPERALQLTYVLVLRFPRNAVSGLRNGDTSNNEPYSNVGCSTQNNIAAMVVNPEILWPADTPLCGHADTRIYAHNDPAYSSILGNAAA